MDILNEYLEAMFSGLPDTDAVRNAKQVLSQMIEDKFEDLLSEGKSEKEAIGTVVSEFGNLQELAEELGLEQEMASYRQPDIDIQKLAADKKESPKAASDEEKRLAAEKAFEAAKKKKSRNNMILLVVVVIACVILGLVLHTTGLLSAGNGKTVNLTMGGAVYELKPQIIWMIVVIAMVLIELATMGLTTIWFAGGALIALFISYTPLGMPAQMAVFIIASSILFALMRPLAQKYFNRSREKTNAQSLIGRTAVVTEAIDNLKAEGVVVAQGLEWTARNVNEEEIIPKDTKVVIRSISGVKLMVEKITS